LLYTLWSAIFEDINKQENEIIQTDNTVAVFSQVSTSPTLQHQNDTLNPEMFSNIPSTSQAEDTPPCSTETPPFSIEPPSILTCPAKRSLATVFNDIIKWPEQQQSKSNRKKEYTPSVITSDKWIEFHDIKTSEKLEKEKQKEERKLATLEKRKQAEIKKIEKADIKAKQKKSIAVVSDTDSTESKMSWNSEVDSSDNELLSQPKSKDLLQKMSNLKQDLKPGDYVLVKFKHAGKKNLL